MIELARLVFAGLALWFALRGIGRLLRTRLRVTGTVVRRLLLAAAALGVAAWLQLSDPEMVSGQINQALGELWDRLAGWVAERVAEAARLLREWLAEQFGLSD